MANGRLKRRLDDLEERRMTQLEVSLGKVERTIDQLGRDGCRVGTRVSEKLDQVADQLGRMDAKLDRIAETTAGQEANIGANAQYIRNVDGALQRHKEMAYHG
jgi:uncharacterized coiled-coil protein SlyX